MSSTFRILSFILILISLSQCNKYKDGPKFSLATKKDRLVGEWILDKCYLNGASYLNFGGYKMGIKRKGEYWMYTKNRSEKGTWSWSDKKQNVTFTYGANSNSGGFGNGPYTAGSYTYEIRRLKEFALWLRFTENNGDVWDFHFKKYIK